MSSEYNGPPTILVKLTPLGEYIIKPTDITQIEEQKTHVPIPRSIDMLKSYSDMPRVDASIEQSTLKLYLKS